MGHARVMSASLRGPLSSILEIGAGDGTFLAKVLRRAPVGLSGGYATLLDRQPSADAVDFSAARQRGWTFESVVADAFGYLERADVGPFDAIVANLFLHHFETSRLEDLLGLVAERTHLFVACEPARSTRGLAGCRMLGVIGCNEVTRHDARISVLAGFRDGELSALWPDAGDWELEERAFFPFGHLFVARRKP